MASRPSQKGADASAVTLLHRSEGEKQGFGPAESVQPANRRRNRQNDGESGSQLDGGP